MATKTEPTTDKKRTPDKSPENDITKAIDLLRSGRAKYIRMGDEKRGGWLLDIIGRCELARDNKEA